MTAYEIIAWLGRHAERTANHPEPLGRARAPHGHPSGPWSRRRRRRARVERLLKASPIEFLRRTCATVARTHHRYASRTTPERFGVAISQTSLLPTAVRSGSCGDGADDVLDVVDRKRRREANAIR